MIFDFLERRWYHPFASYFEDRNGRTNYLRVCRRKEIVSLVTAAGGRIDGFDSAAVRADRENLIVVVHPRSPDDFAARTSSANRWRNAARCSDRRESKGPLRPAAFGTVVYAGPNTDSCAGQRADPPIEGPRTAGRWSAVSRRPVADKLDLSPFPIGRCP